jgi:hypothetical protein
VPVPSTTALRAYRTSVRKKYLDLTFVEEVTDQTSRGSRRVFDIDDDPAGNEVLAELKRSAASLGDQVLPLRE